MAKTYTHKALGSERLLSEPTLFRSVNVFFFLAPPRTLSEFHSQYYYVHAGGMGVFFFFLNFFRSFREQYPRYAIELKTTLYCTHIAVAQ